MSILSVFKSIFGRSTQLDIKSLLDAKSLLVDVRTKDEFANGHPKGSVNIPLADIGNKQSLFKNKSNIIVFCRSGMRSSQAKQLLESYGFKNVYNAGTWLDVKKQIN